MLYFVVLCHGVVFVLYCIVLYCIVLYCIVLYCIVLYCILLYHIILYRIVLYCSVLYCIVLYHQPKNSSSTYVFMTLPSSDKNRKKRSRPRSGYKRTPRYLDEKDQERQPGTLDTISSSTLQFSCVRIFIPRSRGQVYIV